MELSTRPDARSAKRAKRRFAGAILSWRQSVGWRGAAACLLGLTAGLGSARAADLPAADGFPPVFAMDWTGFYAGGQFGAVVNGRGRDVASGDGGLVVSPGFGGRGGRTGNAVGTIDGHDLFTGAHAGYNWQSGRLVYGLEGDVAMLGPVDDLIGSGRVRLGLGGPLFLVYGTAGIAFQSLRGGTTGVFVGGDGGDGGNGGAGGDGGAGGNGFGTLTLGRTASDRVGFVAGGGAEMRLSARVGLGLEALYHGFDGNTAVTGLPNEVLSLRGRLTVYLTPAEPPSAPHIVGPTAWSGLYAGAHLGGITNLSNGAIGNTTLANGENGGPGLRGIDGGGGGGGAVAFAAFQRNTAVIGGALAGYSWQTGTVVRGAEADLGFGADDGHRYLGTLRGRLGLSAAGTLVYATGGAAFSGGAAARTLFAQDGGSGGDGGAVLAAPGGAGGLGGRALVFSRGGMRAGFVVGGGLESKINARLSAGVEGLYYGFGSERAPLPPPTANGRFFRNGGDADAFVLRTRLTYALTP